MSLHLCYVFHNYNITWKESLEDVSFIIRNLGVFSFSDNPASVFDQLNKHL